MLELLDRLADALGDRFRPERELARGAMGIVLLAHDLKHDRKVALKVLRPDVASDVNVERFLREIRITAQLQHPNILPLLDSGRVAASASDRESDVLAYYVTPYVAGESLRQRLRRDGELPVGEAVQIAREIADALGHAHRLGFVHRDIKPENILLSDSHALVADFGVAHLLRPTDGTLTETGVAIGTPTYMSPEQASGAGSIDHRVDIYALGCVLYEMLTGSPPFTGTYQAIMASKFLDSTPPLHARRPAVSAALERVVTTSMAQLPEARYGTANEFGDALARLVEPAREVVRWRRLSWIAAAAVAVAVIAGTYALRPKRPVEGAGGSQVQASFAQLTADIGVEWFPSLSPDGNWVVFAGENRANRDIYVQRVDAHTPTNLTQDSAADDDQPAFSPNGDRIAFRSSRDGGGIFVMNRNGADVRRLTDRGFHPTWSPDGSEIAFTTENVELTPGNFNETSELWVVPAAAGPLRLLASGDATLPSWSPNGHRVAFGRRFGGSGRGGIETISPNGGAAIPLTDGSFRDWGPTWAADGRYVYFSSDRGGSMNLWRIAVDERSGKPLGAPVPVTTPAPFAAHASAAAGGSRIAYTSSLVTVNVQRLAFDPIRAVVNGDPAPVTTGTRQWSSPDPSPDANWVTFYTLNQPEGDLYVARTNGSDLRRVSGDSALDRLPRWSPDGNRLAYFSNRAGALHVWVVRTDGTEQRRLTDTPSNYPAWSPDGTRIAVVLGIAARGETLAVLDPERGAATQRPEYLPPPPMGRFLVTSWSRDGSRLAGEVGSARGVGEGVAIYTFATRSYQRLTDFGEWPVWLPDGQRILFVARRNTYYVVDARTREVRKVWSVERDVLGPPRLSLDGRWIYFSRRTTEADIWMLTLDDRR
jgi:serine/threonine-protein kinase